MKAAWYERKGDPKDVLTVGELPDPQPRPGEVRVKVHISAVNPSDTKQRSGWSGGEMPFPRIIPHNDGAGIIDMVGSGIEPSRIGERVWIFEAQRGGRAFGTAAEYVVVPASNAIPLPAGASFEDGASLGVPGMTAHRLLFADEGIQGQTILVAGGAGSVGHMAVQLAGWAGAVVIATVGSEDQEMVARECGAHHVLNYKQDDIPSRVAALLGHKDGVDRVIEVAFAQNVEVDAEVLKPNGTLATYMIHETEERPAMKLQPLLVKDIAARFTLVYAMPKAAHEQAAQDLNAAMAAGALKPRVAARFPLEKIAEAHERLGTGGMGGKAVIQVGS